MNYSVSNPDSIPMKSRITAVQLDYLLPSLANAATKVPKNSTRVFLISGLFWHFPYPSYKPMQPLIMHSYLCTTFTSGFVSVFDVSVCFTQLHMLAF